MAYLQGKSKVTYQIKNFDIRFWLARREAGEGCM